MIGDQFYNDGRLYRFDYSGPGPPWPLQVWNDGVQAWEDIGRLPVPSTLLVAGSSEVIAADWLRLASGEAIMGEADGAVACSAPQIRTVPDFVLCNDDVIGIGGA